MTCANSLLYSKQLLIVMYNFFVRRKYRGGEEREQKVKKKDHELLQQLSS